jgi:hypothetical protein
MVQNVVVGTLATLNLLMSPLAPGELAQQSYQLELGPNAFINESCLEKFAPGHERLNVSFDEIASQSFQLKLSGKLCTTFEGLKPLSMALTLPTEILDEAFLVHLKAGQGYVLGGLPSATQPGQKVRLKITRLQRQGELDPFTIEWLPSQGQTSENQPLTIWMDLAHSRLSETPRNGSKTLPWKKLRFYYSAPSISRAYVLTGELKSQKTRQ